MECEIKGTPIDINKFVFDLVKLLEKQTGNWIDLKDITWNFSYYMFKIPRIITIPVSLEENIRQICTAQNLSFKIRIYSAGEDKGYANKPNAKILMFGNEDLSSYTFNLWQPYIIAETFEAERIK